MYGPNGIYCGICQQDGHSGIDCTAPLPAWNEEQFQRNQRDLDVIEAAENERLGERGYWR
jgi:hypothetical protein